MVRQDFREFDADKKDTAWFRRVIVELIGKKQWLILPAQYNINMTFADANYDISKTKAKYDAFNIPPEEQFIDFTPLDLLGNRIEAITSIIEKQGFEVKSKCTDPTAVSKREQDIALLKAEKELEPIRKQFAQGLGLSKPLPIASEEDFSSDISPVKEMNLDMTNPVDEGIYKNLFQRQIWEIAVELGISHYFNMSGTREMLKQLVEDMINHHCFSLSCSVNSYSGEPEIERLMPYEAFTILGKRFDRSDAIAKGWERRVSVREAIAFMGRDVTKDELDQFLAAANSASSTNFIGIWYPELVAHCPENFCEHGQFLNMTCMLGYMEMKSQNSDLYIHSYDNGNILTQKQNLDFQWQQNWTSVERMPKKKNEKYLEYKFYDVTYKGYYLPSNHFVYGFGKLPLAVRFGSKNQLTDYSIITYRKNGKSMNQKCQPFIRHFFDLWCKYQHFINESRPSGEAWDMDVVREIANDLTGTDGKVGDWISTLKILQNNVNTIYKTKTIDGVKAVGGDGDPIKPRVRGIDPTVRDIVAYMANDLQQIETITGVNSVLLAQAPPTQDTGYKVSQLYLSQSINTIHYIQSAIEQSFSNAGVNVCQKIQFILNDSKSSPAYKAIEQAIGKRNTEAIKQLGKEPPYTFSIFIEFGMTVAQREEVKQVTNLMMQSKAITAAQQMTINSIQNYKLASALLTYYETKAMQQAQQAGQLAFQQATATEDQKTQGKLAEINAQSQGDLAVADKTGEWAYRVKQLEVSGKDQVQDKKEISKQITQDKKHQQSIQEKVIDKQLEDNAAT